MQTIKSVQYKAALAIIDAIKGTSQAKLHEELGLKRLKFRRCVENYVFFTKL